MTARPLMLVFLLALILGLVACDAKAPALLVDTARAIGVTEPPPLPSRTTTILIDASLHTTATPTAVSDVLDRALRDIAERPVPSCVVIVRMGATVGDLDQVGTACVAAALRNTKAQRRAEERFVETSRERLLPLATAALAAPPRQSPIAATLSRMAMSRATTNEHVWLLLSDGLEESTEIARLECGPLPSEAAFHAALRKEKLLEPGSLRGVDVRFCFFGFSNANRTGCPSSVRRELELRELWRSALLHASARSIQFVGGAPDLRAEVSL